MSAFTQSTARSRAVDLVKTDNFPYQYGLLESVVLAGAFVLVALFETVLSDARFGA